jgi:hypothetical protein
MESAVSHFTIGNAAYWFKEGGELFIVVQFQTKIFERSLLRENIQPTLSHAHAQLFEIQSRMIELSYLPSIDSKLQSKIIFEYISSEMTIGFQFSLSILQNVSNSFFLYTYQVGLPGEFINTTCGLNLTSFFFRFQ